MRSCERLAGLATLDPRKSRVVELRYFGGLSLAETADVLDVSVMTVRRDWRAAKAWLEDENPVAMATSVASMCFKSSFARSILRRITY